MGSPSHGGDAVVYVCWRKPTELAYSFLFCPCVCFCLYGPFNCISFHKLSWQLSTFSLSSFGLISAILVLRTIYLFVKVSLSPHIILCGWLGLKHQLTNFCNANRCAWGYNRSTSVSTNHCCFSSARAIHATKTKRLQNRCRIYSAHCSFTRGTICSNAVFSPIACTPRRDIGHMSSDVDVCQMDLDMQMSFLNARTTSTYCDDRQTTRNSSQLGLTCSCRLEYIVEHFLRFIPQSWLYSSWYQQAGSRHIVTWCTLSQSRRPNQGETHFIRSQVTDSLFVTNANFR